MAIVTWSDAYTINNETLDCHHKTLFDLFNRLYESGFDSQSPDPFHAILSELDIYSNYHFRTEEEFMRGTGYSDVERHMALHNYYISRLEDLKERAGSENGEVWRELIFFLGNWLKHHVIEEDKRISR